MIKRDITETVYEYDNEGKLVKKTVTEKHEEEDNVLKLGDIVTSPYTPPLDQYDWRKYQITCDQAPNITLQNNSTSDLTNNINQLTTNCTIQD